LLVNIISQEITNEKQIKRCMEIRQHSDAGFLAGCIKKADHQGSAEDVKAW